MPRLREPGRLIYWDYFAFETNQSNVESIKSFSSIGVTVEVPQAGLSVHVDDLCLDCIGHTLAGCWETMQNATGQLQLPLAVSTA